MRHLFAGLIATSLLAGCATMPASHTATVGGTLMMPSGQPVGTVTLVQHGSAIMLHVTAGPMAPGTYGIHVHGIGRCDGPDFASAGAHWNPTMKQHGLMNPAGHHSGDLDNLVIAADGPGSIDALVPGMIDGPGGLLDADGAAVVIHTHADDGRSDPSGNSGARIACAVIAHG